MRSARVWRCARLAARCSALKKCVPALTCQQAVWVLLQRCVRQGLPDGVWPANSGNAQRVMSAFVQQQAAAAMRFIGLDV
jgi:hypothetical protein